MDRTHVIAIVAGIALGLAVSSTGGLLASFGGAGGGFADAEISSFETSDPYCGDPNRTSGSSLTTPEAGPGETLVVNSTVSVAGPDSELSARVDTWGERRHTLELDRDSGAQNGDCQYKVRYYATVAFPTDDWTLLVSVDNELVSGHWREGRDGGSFSRVPDSPSRVGTGDS